MSLLVVINGPVETAGSSPLLDKTNGIAVPITAAMTITVIKATQIVTEIK